MSIYEIASVLVNSLAGIGACFAAAAALLTIREMRMQRAYSYRPDILVPSIRFVSFRNDIVGRGDFVWSACYDHTVEGVAKANLPQVSDLRVNLYNFGFGAARHIDFTWDLDLSD